MGQTTSQLTESRYKVATVYVDHKSDYTFVRVQESTSADKTVEGKNVFE